MKKSTKIIIAAVIAVVVVGGFLLCSLCTSAGELVSNYLGHLADYFN